MKTHPIRGISVPQMGCAVSFGLYAIDERPVKRL